MKIPTHKKSNTNKINIVFATLINMKAIDDVLRAKHKVNT
jgi:hypothetical protein